MASRSSRVCPFEISCASGGVSWILSRPGSLCLLWIMNHVTTFDEVCATLEPMLAGPAREAIVREAAAAGNLGNALIHLRKAMRSHVWRIGGAIVDLERAIQRYDRRTRSVGFHVLNDWDGVADRVNDDTIPVDVLHYLVDRRGSEPA